MSHSFGLVLILSKKCCPEVFFPISQICHCQWNTCECNSVISCNNAFRASGQSQRSHLTKEIFICFYGGAITSLVFSGTPAPKKSLEAQLTHIPKVLSFLTPSHIAILYQGGSLYRSLSQKKAFPTISGAGIPNFQKSWASYTNLNKFLC